MPYNAHAETKRFAKRIMAIFASSITKQRGANTRTAIRRKNGNNNI